MKIKLLSDRILVKPMRLREFFGIIPENQKNRDESVIVAIGPKVKELKGDTVRKFPQVLGVPYTEDGVDYLISEGSDNPRRADVEFRINQPINIMAEENDIRRKKSSKKF
jgi:co-chaperonin GroES (HSP10)